MKILRYKHRNDDIRVLFDVLYNVDSNIINIITSIYRFISITSISINSYYMEFIVNFCQYVLFRDCCQEESHYQPVVKDSLIKQTVNHYLNKYGIY